MENKKEQNNNLIFTGKITITKKNINIHVYISKRTIFIYLDKNKFKETEIKEIENELNIKYNRKTTIKNTFMDYIIPDNFTFSKKGIFIEKIKKIDGEEISIMELICDKWLFIKNKIYSVELDMYQYEVMSVNPITKKEIIKLCNKDILCKYSTCMSFLSSKLDVNVDENKRKDYTLFFYEFIKENDKNFVEKTTINTLGWNEKITEFAPYSKKIHLDYSNDKYNSFKNMVNAFNNPHEFKRSEFLEKMIGHCKNKHADFIISACFAAPLIKMIANRSFLINVYGMSKTQKSLTARIGLSVFGNYEKLEMSGNDTRNSITTKIHKLQNLVCYVDEIVQKGKNESVINGYVFSNGRDRARLDKESEIKENKTWKTTCICTSETSIQKDSDMNGEINRYISLRVDCRPKKIKDNEDKCHEYACKYYRFLSYNYGSIGKEYIEQIIKIGKDRINEYYSEIEKYFIDNNRGNNLTDHISNIASVCLANYLYRKTLYKIDDINFSKNLGIYILSQLQSKNDLSIDNHYVNAMYSFFEINRNNFIDKENPNKNTPIKIFGSFDVKNNEIIFIYPPLKEYLENNNFDWNHKTELSKNGVIDIKNKMINGVQAKRIIIPLSPEISKQCEIKYLEEERKAIQEEN